MSVMKLQLVHNNRNISYECALPINKTMASREYIRYNYYVTKIMNRSSASMNSLYSKLPWN